MQRGKSPKREVIEPASDFRSMTRVPVGIVTLKNRTLSPVAKLFIDHAHDVARPLAKGK